MFVILVIVFGVVGLTLFGPGTRRCRPGWNLLVPAYKVLDPIRHGSLTVFPVVASKSYATSEFLTLDEGLRSGEVVVTEYGNIRGLARRTCRARSASANRRSEPVGAHQQFEASSAVAGGRDCYRRQTGPRNWKRPHRPCRERSRRSQRVLRRAGTLGCHQRALRNFRDNLCRWHNCGKSICCAVP